MNRVYDDTHDSSTIIEGHVPCGAHQNLHGSSK